MKLEFYKAKEFDKIMKSVRVLNEEATLVFSGAGLSVREMDPGHYMMVELKLPREMFDIYDLDPMADPVKVGVNLDALAKQLKRAGKDERLVLEYTKDAPEVALTIIGSVTRNKTIPAIEPLDAEVPEPKLIHYSSARLVADTVGRVVIPDLAEVSEYAKISIDADEIVFSAVGDIGKCRVVYSRDHDEVLEIRCDKAGAATYSLSWLAAGFKGFKGLAEVVDLRMSEDMPIRIDAEMPQGSLVYHLAPLIGV